MNACTLNGKLMKTRDDAYDHISRSLGLPDYFGRNLDALYDVLTSVSASVTLKNAAAMINALGSYGCDVIRCFCDAAAANGKFRFKLK